jgi:hypothetical protein
LVAEDGLRGVNGTADVFERSGALMARVLRSAEQCAARLVRSEKAFHYLIFVKSYLRQIWLIALKLQIATSFPQNGAMLLD